MSWRLRGYHYKGDGHDRESSQKLIGKTLLVRVGLYE